MLFVLLSQASCEIKAICGLITKTKNQPSGEKTAASKLNGKAMPLGICRKPCPAIVGLDKSLCRPPFPRQRSHMVSIQSQVHIHSLFGAIPKELEHFHALGASHWFHDDSAAISGYIPAATSLDQKKTFIGGKAVFPLSNKKCSEMQLPRGLQVHVGMVNQRVFDVGHAVAQKNCIASSSVT